MKDKVTETKGQVVLNNKSNAINFKPFLYLIFGIALLLIVVNILKFYDIDVFGFFKKKKRKKPIANKKGVKQSNEVNNFKPTQKDDKKEKNVEQDNSIIKELEETEENEVILNENDNLENDVVAVDNEVGVEDFNNVQEQSISEKDNEGFEPFIEVKDTGVDNTEKEKQSDKKSLKIKPENGSNVYLKNGSLYVFRTKNTAKNKHNVLLHLKKIEDKTLIGTYKEDLSNFKYWCVVIDGEIGFIQKNAYNKSKVEFSKD
jgi:hypothetical protein